MNRYKKYKPSGIEWIGDLPINWGLKRLKYVAKIQPSNVDKKTIEDEKPVLLCNYMDVYRNEFIDSTINFMEATATENEIKKFRIKKGDVLITKDSETADDIANPALVKDDFENVICAYHLAQVRTDKKYLLGEYLFRLFQENKFKAQFEVAANGVTRYGLSVAAFTDAFIPLPPKEEQTAIANYLEEKTSQIDKLVANKQKLIELFKEERLVIVDHVITKGINSKSKLKYSGFEWLGEIPEHWKIKKLRYLGSLQNGVSKGNEYFGSGFPFVSYGDVYNNEILPDMASGLALSSEADRENYSVLEGDVFFTRTSETIEEIGICSTCINRIRDATFSGFLIRFRPLNGFLLKQFSTYYFRSQLHRKYFVKEMNLVTRASLSQDLLKNLPVLIPPIDEQRNISDYIQAETKRIDITISKIEKEIELMQEYRTALISEVVTGKIKIT